MPQLDPTWFVSQLFWLCICFFSMLFIMSKFFVPKIADILAQRQHKIDDYLNKATQITKQAEESLEKYNEALNNATLQANESLAQTQKELEDFIGKKQNDLTLKLNEKIKEGEIQIAKSKEAALKEVRIMAESLALDVVKKISLNDIKPEDIKNAIAKVAND